MVARSSDAGISRIPVLFTLVGVLIVASIVSLVLVSNRTDSHGRTTAAAAATTSRPGAGPASAALRTAGRAAPTESTSPVARTSRMSAAPTPVPATRAPVTYTVRPGDNLTVIAAWFKLHGYGDLYQRNRAVIGSDPNLILPGERITVSSAGMTVSK